MRAFIFSDDATTRLHADDPLLAEFPDECRLATDTLGCDLELLCVDGDRNDMMSASLLHSGALLGSVLRFLRLARAGLEEQALLLGRGVGLYAALVVSRALDLGGALRAVARRAEIIARVRDGAMLSVAARAEQIATLLAQHSLHDVAIASYESVSECVLSGPARSIAETQVCLSKHGVVCSRLQVRTPFCSPHMEAARIELMRALMDERIASPRIPVISMISARELTRDYVVEELGFQLVRPVRWWQTLAWLHARHPELSCVQVTDERMPAPSFNTFIEQAKERD